MSESQIWPDDGKPYRDGDEGGMVFGSICESCGFDESVIWFESIENDPAGGTTCSGCGTVYAPDGTQDRARTEARRAAGCPPVRPFDPREATSPPFD